MLSAVISYKLNYPALLLENNWNIRGLLIPVLSY